MKIAICAGKTGGHTFPALAVARFLKLKDISYDPFFIGTKTGIDEACLKVDGFKFFGISGSGLSIGLKWKTLKWVVHQLTGVAQVLKIFKQHKPHVVLSFGGYISSAPVLVAKWMGVPVVIHESNIQPGRANRFLSRWADAVCVGFPGTFSFHEPRTTNHERRFQVTGLPVREKFFSTDRLKAFKLLGLDPHKKVVLIMGGSLGSRKINDSVLAMVHELGDCTNKVQIIHVTGRNDYARVMEQYKPNGLAYKPYAFLDEVEHAFHAADLFIGRAGASTLAELTCCGLPAVLIPFPHAMEDHQRANAQYLEREGAALVIEDRECSAQALVAAMKKILFNEEVWLFMAQKSKKLGVPDGTARIVRVLEEIVYGLS